jgi:hypothetical protein
MVNIRSGKSLAGGTFRQSLRAKVSTLGGISRKGGATLFPRALRLAIIAASEN